MALAQLQAAVLEKPEVFSYINYRSFLQDYCRYLSSKNPQFSESAFIRKAGYGSNSRGYLGLIVKGKRNLSPKAIIRFAQACQMDSKELSYFENLVYFNQAQNSKDKDFYFQRMSKAIKGKASKAYQLLRSQYRYCSHWYVVAIRELVSFGDFTEDPAWIVKCLNYKVTKKQILQSIQDLLELNLLQRDQSGKLYQTETLVRFAEEEASFTILANFHQQMLDLSKAALERPYRERSASSVILTCHEDDLSLIRKEIKEFRSMILSKYGKKAENLKQILTMNIQLFPLTQILSGEEKTQ